MEIFKTNIVLIFKFLVHIFQLKGIQDIRTLFDNCDHNNQFRSNRKSGPWFLSTKFQIPMNFTCAFPKTSSRLDTFQFFRRKLLHWLNQLSAQKGCQHWPKLIKLFKAHFMKKNLQFSKYFIEYNYSIQINTLIL